MRNVRCVQAFIAYHAHVFLHLSPPETARTRRRLAYNWHSGDIRPREDAF
jgi:hypothetical protein